MRPLTCACLQAGHKGAGRGGPAPLSQKTDLLRTCTSWQTLAWGSAGFRVPTGSLGGFSCPYPNSHPEMAAGARLSAPPGPKEGDQCCGLGPQAVCVLAWVGLPIDALAASLFQLKYKI